MPAALLFDLDGTLIDSDPLHRAVFADLLAPHGHVVDAAFYLAHIHGRQNRAIFAELMPGADPDEMDRAKEAEFRRRLAGAPVAATPGLGAFLERTGKAGLPAAVVTNACRANAHAMLAALGVADRFAAILGAEDAPAPKPDPAPYRAGAAALGVAATECIAFEDSPAGLASARAAGCTVVGLASSLDADALRAAGAHHVIPDFTDPALVPLLATATGAPA